MKLPRVKPFLYKDECDNHGHTNFIVELQMLDFKNGTVTFIFYCKKCWLEDPDNVSAWQAVLKISEYNKYFGFTSHTDN
jgi:hypothetical protein